MNTKDVPTPNPTNTRYYHRVCGQFIECDKETYDRTDEAERRCVSVREERKLKNYHNVVANIPESVREEVRNEMDELDKIHGVVREEKQDGGEKEIAAIANRIYNTLHTNDGELSTNELVLYLASLEHRIQKLETTFVK